MRQWCADNNKILFDFADIEAYDMNGNPCYDNRDGVPYYYNGQLRENYPDDGFDYPAVCQEKATETGMCRSRYIWSSRRNLSRREFNVNMN